MEHMGYLLLTYTLLLAAAQAQLNSYGDDSDNIIAHTNNAVDFVSTSLPVRTRAQKITTDSNKKPMFTDCESYNRAQVQEEQDARTYVIEVKANDDDPPNAGGTVTYKIVKRDGGKDYFIIDNSTGQVRTNTPFDRDEPFRQKEMYVTVQATDNGRPPLSDICTFKVTITDINDNIPQLDQQSYYANVAEDLKVNSEVMRIFAYDIDDGNNSRVTYSFREDSIEFTNTFRIDADTGVVYLQETLTGRIGFKFTSQVFVRDNGDEPKATEAPIEIEVVGSDKKAPQVLEKIPDSVLQLSENFRNFTEPLVTIVAKSNIEEEDLAFELIKGKTLQTNKDQTFILQPSKENTFTAQVLLARPLDYETVTDYTLSIRIRNKDLMDTSVDIPIRILDVNDELPNFIEFIQGSVVENDEVGAQAMVVRAIDKDGTAENNIVNYELLSNVEQFSIDQQSGIIKSRQRFDRELVTVYNLKVRAFDNSPSALKNTGEPNEAVQIFQIAIEDRNDNAPKFTYSVYNCTDVLEDSNIGNNVGEVKAEDKDSASLIIYSIVEGNIDDAFVIENTTGRIKVNKQLDFEKVEQYRLRVRAFDGIYEDFALVQIFIANVNDEIPVFAPHDKNITIEEETIPAGCIINVDAYDPDIKDRSANQHILYAVEVDFLKVSSTGCVSLTKKLDRDRPFGSPFRQAFIYAYDNDGGPNSVSGYSEIIINLDDINDNAPFLNVTEVVWYENQDPGIFNEITDLSADDYDGPANGPPFTFELASEASEEIKNKFSIRHFTLLALVMFDREEKKYYDIPILVTDSGIPPQRKVSILRVIIGDRNDNAAKDGSSQIFVYKYEYWNTNIPIGRVYVDDPDDWDLLDKVFIQRDDFDYFRLSEEDRGMIIMSSGISEGTYLLRFNVKEEHLPEIPLHTVSANVTVTVKDIPEEAVVKSGSIRIDGATIEEFVEEENGISRKDILRDRVAEIVNTSSANVDVFTVLTTPSNISLIDVRFSAHGSPYYAPEKLNNKITDNQEKLEEELGVKFIMVSINECLNENVCGEGNSCSNNLKINNDEPAAVYTNKTSFVGVRSLVEATCVCRERVPLTCLNGGSMQDQVCSCPAGYEGPYCESLSIAFTGRGWAMYPGLESCNSTEITLTVTTQDDNGLVFYAGPLTYRHAQLSKDFISLELLDGVPKLKIYNAIDQIEVSSRDNNRGPKSLNDGAPHKIRISISYSSAGTNVEMEIDDCKSNCLQVQTMPASLLRINGPLQMGGLSKKFSEEDAKLLWNTLAPMDTPFQGCIRNFSFNHHLYNLGQPSDSYEAFPDCSYALQQAVSFGIDSNFLVAILVCIAVLFLLLLAVVVHRRQHDNLNEKDIDDTTENIINYEDEGGGESDAHYNLSVFPPTTKEPLQRKEPDINSTEPDISVFLDNKKDNCDKDPENLPYDDVRHYAYEGDGNSTGSLSSLGSCTDDGDLDFNYLSSFGKRFSKLADMYDYDGSDDDTQNGGDEAWC
ncbi:DE-cadherin [Euwallacea fornicatus]|uniref:DE-cadherin n=1 Tax=Euwallacea fornicatus TaxID=995702 RepID=UPI00338E7482